MARNTSVSLGDHFTTFIERQLAGGRYGSVSDVVRAGLRLLEQQELEREALLAAGTTQRGERHHPAPGEGALPCPGGRRDLSGACRRTTWHRRDRNYTHARCSRTEARMALSIKDPETDRLARAVAALTGESLTTAIRTALAERLAREQQRQGRRRGVADRLREIARECAALPVLDPRSPEEIIGYDEHGLPR